MWILLFAPVLRLHAHIPQAPPSWRQNPKGQLHHPDIQQTDNPVSRQYSYNRVQQ